MKIKKFITISSILALMGIAFGVTSIIDAKPVEADDVIETKLHFYNGDELAMEYNSEKSEYYIEHTYISDATPFVIMKGDTMYGISAVDNDSIDFFEEIDIPDYIYVRESEFYSIYLTSDDEIHGVVFNPELEAQIWAHNFLDNGIDCDPNYIEPPNNWDNYSRNFQEKLSNEAKNIFGEADARNDTYASEIEQCAYIHDLCVSKYGFSVFMYSNEGTRSPAYNPYTNNIINFNITALVITIVSAVTVTSLLALLIFKKNKRK